MAESLPAFPLFDASPDAGDVAVRWTKWVARFKNLMKAINVTDVERQKALLLHYAGEETNDIFDTLPVPVAAEGENLSELEKVVKALTTHFAPKRNREYEVYKFRQAKQEKGEDITRYHTRLKQLSTTCEFADVDREIKSQIVQSCESSRLRRKALGDPDMTLTKMLETARAMEVSETQASGIERAPSTNMSPAVNKLSHKHTKPRRWDRSERSSGSNKVGQPAATCRNCGQSWPHDGGKTACPAFGKECRNCKKMNHYSSCCRSDPAAKPTAKTPTNRKPQKRHQTRVNKLETQDSSGDDAYVYTVELCTMSAANHEARPRFKISLNGQQLSVIADSGADINIIDEQDYSKLQPRPKLRSDNTKIFPYGSKTPLLVKGVFNADVQVASLQSTELFYVIAGSGGSLLGWKTSKRLNLVRVVQNLTSVSQTRCSVEQLVQDYDDLFQGLGKLKDFQVKLHVDESVSPVAQPHRRIPFHVRKQLEDQLKKDEELGVIERVEGATPWVSPLVVVPKPKSPGQVRVCVDMRQANQAIARERHVTPTINELVSDLNGAAVFSKLDLNQGYNQLELHPSSRYITTFSTHFGLWRYKRLNFGVSSAAEVFQNAIRETLSDISGAVNISDDILVFGASQEEHDANLKATFQRLRECGLTLNRGKCAYNKSTLEFFGHVFSKGGLSADPKKVLAVQDLPTPSDPTQVRSLLGMSNFCARFIPDYASMTQPLRDLTKKGSVWNWTPECSASLKAIRQALSSAPVLEYFDIDKTTQLYVDASPVGLGGVLVQTDKEDNSKQRVIAYGSRSLTPVEQRYSQTEREALAVIWACEHFHIYIYGQPIMIYTDHKPLVSIYGNPKSKPPARIERWTLRLQPYDATVVYRPGSDNPADFLSRHPCNGVRTSSREQKIAEEFVSYITANLVPKAMSVERVRRETLTDPTLQAVIQSLITGKWYLPTSGDVDQKAYRSFELLKDELTATADRDVVLRDHRLVIPTSLQKEAVDLAHEGHQGIVRTKSLIREKIWFPGIDKLTNDCVKSCIPCQASVPETKREPLLMTDLPRAPWTEVSADFADLPSGEHLLVLVDDYSRFPLVDIVSSTSASVVIPRIDKMFSEYGIPEKLRTDNGPPFNSRSFTDFAHDLGFHHRKVTPYWPRANGEVERFMRTVKKIIKTANAARRNWKQDMYRFLRNYRATPHSTTGYPPATLMFSRAMRTKLPEFGSSVTSQPVPRQDVLIKDHSQKQKMKRYADDKAYVKPSNIQEGDSVLVKPTTPRRKTDPVYYENPYSVVSRKGSMVTAQRGDHRITRNSSFFKSVKPTATTHIISDSESDDEEPTSVPDGTSGNDVPVVNVPDVPSAQPRYPVRTRKRPTYLSDYKC